MIDHLITSFLALALPVLLPIALLVTTGLILTTKAEAEIDRHERRDPR